MSESAERRPRGRPRLAKPRRVVVEVYLTAEEAAVLDGRRGTEGRSEWLACASGIRVATQ